MPHRKVVHPPAQYRIYRFDHPIDRLRSQTPKYGLQFPYQCRSLLALFERIVADDLWTPLSYREILSINQTEP